MTAEVPSHDEHRARQNRILDQTLELLKDSPHVLGVAAGGSWSRCANDAFSDLDVACYLRDEARTVREDLYACVGEVAPVLCRLWLYDVHALYLFENGVRLDLDFLPPSALPKNPRAAAERILHDPDGVLAARPPAPPGPEPAEHPRHFAAGDPAYVDWYFWMFRQIVGWTGRGAQGDYRAFDKLSGAADSLAQVRAGLIEMRRWTLGANDYVGRLDADFARRLGDTYPHLSPEEIRDGAGRLLDEFERACPAYCRKAGIEYPARKTETMRRLMEEFARLR